MRTGFGLGSRYEQGKGGDSVLPEVPSLHGKGSDNE